MIALYLSFLQYIPVFAGHAKRRIVIALYNYTAREETDVSFVKGDRMEVLDDTESDWWRVIHLTTRQEGLIPWNFVAEERSVNSEEYVFFCLREIPHGKFPNELFINVCCFTCNFFRLFFIKK